MIALLLLLLSGSAKAESYQLPHAYHLAVREDGVPLLQYEQKKKGGILAFKMAPRFLDPVALPAPLASELKVEVLGSGTLITDSRCTQSTLYDLFCQVLLSEVGERVLIQSLNRGMLTLSLRITAEPSAEVYPSTPVGSKFDLAGSVQSSYFSANPIALK